MSSTLKALWTEQLNVSAIRKVQGASPQRKTKSKSYKGGKA